VIPPCTIVEAIEYFQICHIEKAEGATQSPIQQVGHLQPKSLGELVGTANVPRPGDRCNDRQAPLRLDKEERIVWKEVERLVQGNPVLPDLVESRHLGR
jgi:hypothetical protein